MGESIIIYEDYIHELLEMTKNPSREEVDRVLERAKNCIALSHKDIATLLQVDDKEVMEEVFKIAGQVKGRSMATG